MTTETGRITELDEYRIREPLWSVQSRVSWGALVAGAVVAIAVYSLLTLLGVAIGITVSDRFEAEQLGKAASIWTFATLLISMFIGGWVTTRCTAGEFKSEAALYGVIVWAITSAILIPLAAAGIGTGVGTVLASHGFAKVKEEVVPMVANAHRAVNRNINKAKDQVSDAGRRLETAAEGEKSENDSASDNSDASKSKGEDSSPPSDESTAKDRGADRSADRKSEQSSQVASEDRDSNDSDRSTDDNRGINSPSVKHQTREQLRAASWWAFGGTFASLVAAICGALVGPTIVIKHQKIQNTRIVAPTVTVRSPVA